MTPAQIEAVWIQNSNLAEGGFGRVMRVDQFRDAVSDITAATELGNKHTGVRRLGCRGPKPGEGGRPVAAEVGESKPVGYMVGQSIAKSMKYDEAKRLDELEAATIDRCAQRLHAYMIDAGLRAWASDAAAALREMKEK